MLQKGKARLRRAALSGDRSYLFASRVFCLILFSSYTSNTGSNINVSIILSLVLSLNKYDDEGFSKSMVTNIVHCAIITPFRSHEYSYSLRAGMISFFLSFILSFDHFSI